MSIDRQKTHDVFVTHAWRYHDDWNRLCSVLNSVSEFRWRNFSVPWYDPAMDINSALGAQFVNEWLESQIRPCHVVVALEGVYAIKSARRWFVDEISLARKFQIPIGVLPVFGQMAVGCEVSKMGDRILSWDPQQLARSLTEISRP